MKKLLFLLSLLPIIVHAQHVELGLNDDGRIFNVTASVRFSKHFKAGLGYEYGMYQSNGLFGGSWETQLNIPFCYAEYYNAVRKHEFYYGVTIGRMNIVDYEYDDYHPKAHGAEIGIHAGYSRKLIKGLYANAQIGIFYVHTSSNDYTSHGGIIIPTIGLHYIF